MADVKTGHNPKGIFIMAHQGHDGQSLPQFLSIGGRVVAELLPTGILDRHKFYRLQKPPSIGYDVQLLRDAERLGATIARNRDESRGLAYVAPITRIWELGFERDYGWGRQFFLPLRYWDVLYADGRIVEAKLTTSLEALVQLPLFGELL